MFAPMVRSNRGALGVDYRRMVARGVRNAVLSYARGYGGPMVARAVKNFGTQTYSYLRGKARGVGTSTSAGGKTYRSYGSSSSNLRGVYRGRGKSIFRRSRRGKKRYTKWIASRAKRQFSGAAFVKQVGGTVEDDQAVHIAINNTPIRVLFRSLINVVIRRLFIKSGYDVDDDASFIDGWNTGCNITCIYRTTPANAESTLSLNGVAGEKFYELVDRITTQWDASMSANPNAVFDRISLRRGGTDGSYGVTTRAYLRDARFNILTRNALKVQNRSINVVGNDQDDDVDRCPIKGTVCYGKGSAPIPNDTFWTADFYGDGTTAVVSQLGGTNQLLQTTLNPTTFSTTKNFTKFTMDPGAVKTHVVSDKINVTFNAIIRWIRVQRTLDATDTRMPYGSHKVISFEKVIGNVGDNTQPVKVIYESELKMWIGFTWGQERYNRPINLTVI